eukprot:CAMPEP_0181488060 /NCGR_PEP_ID=MMETSP1110-20121109/48179_1 /TAXON_ID=174948 /ORGANISM="Symbiodinium sp., Strain CCMP421" /LENGTH=155 /DNA_ID=CAMNT_0023614665 /DNA_START=92 /DNA_END=555 /DNA_ORIENTATION=+
MRPIAMGMTGMPPPDGGWEEPATGGSVRTCWCGVGPCAAGLNVWSFGLWSAGSVSTQMPSLLHGPSRHWHTPSFMAMALDPTHWVRPRDALQPIPGRFMQVELKQQLSPTHCGGCSGCSIALSIFCSAFSAMIPATLPAMAVAMVAGSCPAAGIA